MLVGSGAICKEHQHGAQTTTPTRPHQNRQLLGTMDTGIESGSSYAQDGDSRRCSRSCCSQQPTGDYNDEPGQFVIRLFVYRGEQGPTMV